MTGILALLSVHWKLATIAGLSALLLASGAWSWHEHSQRLIAEGVAREQSRVADSTLKVVTPVRIQAETTVVRDTRTLTKLIAHTDTVRDTVLLHLTDTVLVKQFITAADSSLKACSVLVSDCAAFRTSATTEIQALKSKLAAATSVPAKSCTVPTFLGAVVGGAAGYLAHRR